MLNYEFLQIHQALLCLNRSKMISQRIVDCPGEKKLGEIVIVYNSGVYILHNTMVVGGGMAAGEKNEN